MALVTHPRGMMFQEHLRGARRFASCSTGVAFGAALLTLRWHARRYASCMLVGVRVLRRIRRCSLNGMRRAN